MDWRWNDKEKSAKSRRAYCLKFYFSEELRKHPSLLTGDSTPSYLTSPDLVIPRLKEAFPWDVKFFIMLRDPVKRARSHFAMVTSQDGTAEQRKVRGKEWLKKRMSTSRTKNGRTLTKRLKYKRLGRKFFVV